MNSRDASRFALSAFLAAVLLAACSGSQLPLQPVTEMQNARASSSERLAPAYALLFSFDGHDGANPRGLLGARSALYGTTAYGGTGHKANKGTVFSITTAGDEHVLYSFEGVSNGQLPNSGLVDVRGTLYGTTYYGGDREGSHCDDPAQPNAITGGCGTVFSITAAGKERILYRFVGGDDGRQPYAGVIDVNGTLYGTTGGGGTHGEGTVFSVTTAGKERVLYSFGNKPYDGEEPAARLLDVNGVLYGTTFSGGKGLGTNCPGTGGCGTVFSITTAGKERVLHSFGVNSGDGTEPSDGALIDVGGTLYGTTDAGGAFSSCFSGDICGTVFSITTTGKEQVLYSFGASPDDGGTPSGLTNVRGTLYGTTVFGGQNGDGTVFSITTAGMERVLYSFAGEPDGKSPGTGVIEVANRLYGTTAGGGSHNDGAVFSLRPYR